MSYNDGNLPVGYSDSNKVITGQAVRSVAGIAGGIVTGVLGALGGIPGIVAGGVVAVVGLGALASKDTADKKAGAVAFGAGALAAVSSLGIPLIGGIAGGLLGLSTVGLLGMGIWNGVKFLHSMHRKKHE
jgi:hypothetical protein